MGSEFSLHQLQQLINVQQAEGFLEHSHEHQPKAL
jgi:hypothetical protein